jgi:dolichyl-phosphate beta-glucosyltransferase
MGSCCSASCRCDYRPYCPNHAGHFHFLTKRRIFVFLSIIIPAYNEETRLPDTLNKVGSFLGTQSYSHEVLIVNNNSTDKTEEIIKDYCSRFPDMQGLFEEEPGKGAAVRCGMLQAQGKFVFMCDADLSMPIEELVNFLPPKLEGIDISIASREAPGAIRYNEPQFRHFGGRMMNWLIQLFILQGLNDTQCGFKCFSNKQRKTFLTTRLSQDGHLI